MKILLVGKKFSDKNGGGLFHLKTAASLIVRKMLDIKGYFIDIQDAFLLMSSITVNTTDRYGSCILCN